MEINLIITLKGFFFLFFFNLAVQLIIYLHLLFTHEPFHTMTMWPMGYRIHYLGKAWMLSHLLIWLIGNWVSLMRNINVQWDFISVASMWRNAHLQTRWFQYNCLSHFGKWWRFLRMLNLGCNYTTWAWLWADCMLGSQKLPLALEMRKWTRSFYLISRRCFTRPYSRYFLLFWTSIFCNFVDFLGFIIFIFCVKCNFERGRGGGEDLQNRASITRNQVIFFSYLF